MTEERDRLRDELLAVTAARGELDPSHDRELIEHFLDKLDGEIDRRIDQRLSAKAAAPASPLPFPFAVAVVPISLILAIPLTAIAGASAGLAGIIVVWAAIAAIVYSVTRR